MKIKLLFTSLLIICALMLTAQGNSKQISLDIYGFVMIDAGYNFGQIHPELFDVLRTTKLPSSNNEFGIYYQPSLPLLCERGYTETPPTIFLLKWIAAGKNLEQESNAVKNRDGLIRNE